MDTRAVLAVVRVSVAVIVLAAIGTDIVAQAGRGSHDLVNTLSFFTVQSNLIGAAVLLVAAARWRREPTPALDWWRGGAVVYLLVTMVVYNLLLTSDEPMSWTNAVVHALFPIYLVIDWLLQPPGASIGWGRALLWLVFPTVYLAYTFMRGALVGWYPYPFFDLDTNSAVTVIAYTAGLYAFGLVLIALVRLSGEWLVERRASRSAGAVEGRAAQP
jgi:hypothetical protein